MPIDRVRRCVRPSPETSPNETERLSIGCSHERLRDWYFCYCGSFLTEQVTGGCDVGLMI